MKWVGIAALWVLFCGHGLMGNRAYMTDYERQIVAACLILEAASEGAYGMQAVLNVMHNRAGGDVSRVVGQAVAPGAFTSMRSVWNQPRPDYGPLLRRAQRDHMYGTAVRLVMMLESGHLGDNTFGATHYHTVAVRPYWASEFHFVTRIGRHLFYRRDPVPWVVVTQ